MTGGALGLRVMGSGGRSLSLTHYPAGESQARHTHDHTQVSFLLAGQIQETIGGRLHEVLTSRVCVKRLGVEHSDAWGPAGAVIASIRLATNDVDGAAPRERWADVDSPAVTALLRLAFGGEDADQVIDDCLALVPGTAETAPVAAPPWLRRARDAAISEEPGSVAGIAREAGVDRVHLARIFRRTYGAPISVVRQRARTSRAIAMIWRGEAPLADVALAAGFADQSHMSRAVSATTGLAPYRLRTLLSAMEDDRSGRRRARRR